MFVFMSSDNMLAFFYYNAFLLQIKLIPLFISILHSWITACKSVPWCLREAQKYPLPWRDEDLKEEVT